jgi:hypothetical protein
LLGGALGVVPQCGFSAAASGLYAGRLITVGTLLAVYLSTSDEMIPVMINHGVSIGFMLAVLLCKLVIAVVVGFATDEIYRLLPSGNATPEPQIEDLCEREHCKCGDNFAKSALNHTLKTIAFIFLVSLALNATVEIVGEDALSSLVLNKPVLGSILSAIVGLIPNCASSVAITQLYLSGVLSAGALLSGLLVGAGVGLLVLLRTNRPIKGTLRIVAILLGVGILAGLLFDLTSLGALLGI